VASNQAQQISCRSAQVRLEKLETPKTVAATATSLGFFANDWAHAGSSVPESEIYKQKSSEVILGEIEEVRNFDASAA
jgi:hypothetical protein